MEAPFLYVEDKDVQSFKDNYINNEIELYGESTKYQDKVVFLGSSGLISSKRQIYGVELENSLLSYSTTKALTAYQGKILNDDISYLSDQIVANEAVVAADINSQQVYLTSNIAYLTNFVNTLTSKIATLEDNISYLTNELIKDEEIIAYALNDVDTKSTKV